MWDVDSFYPDRGDGGWCAAAHPIFGPFTIKDSSFGQIKFDFYV